MNEAGKRRVAARLAVALTLSGALAGAGWAIRPAPGAAAPGAAAPGAAAPGGRPGLRTAAEPPLVTGGEVRNLTTASPSVPAALRTAARNDVTLGAEAIAPLNGTLAPVAVPSPDGRLLAYETWTEPRPVEPGRSWSQQGIKPGDPLGVPSLRLKDLSGDGDQLLAAGASSLAWGADGRIAYVQGRPGELRAGEPWTGDVVVRDGVGGQATAWTTVPAHYTAAAWAGRHLLVHRTGAGERLDLLVLDGPGRIRELGEGTLVAVSPDGTRAFVEQTASEPVVRVVDVATGADVARLDLRPTGAGLTWVGYSGDWQGDAIVASTDVGLAVFRLRDGTLSLAEVLHADDATYPYGVQEPRFTDESASAVVGWAPAGLAGPAPSRRRSRSAAASTAGAPRARRTPSGRSTR